MRTNRFLPQSLVFLAGCASGGIFPGWTGEGAEPFDGVRGPVGSFASPRRP